MSKYKLIIYGVLTLILTACLDFPKEQFFSTRLSDKNPKMEYQDIHQLNLAINGLVKEVDESGFSPKLKTHFTLKDLSDGPWPQAWVAFNIDVYLKDKKLARQVKKANRLSGRATAPMTKTETITIIKEIPTSFMTDSDRLPHHSTGRTAVMTDVVNRSSAGATKP